MNIRPLVVDLSHYQNVRDFRAVHDAGFRGVINKATEGAGAIDKTFAIRRSTARTAGLLYGGYHFLRPGNIAGQVAHFLDVTRPDDQLLLALDHEDPKVPLDDAKEFLALLRQKVGRDAILYSGFLIKQQLGNRLDPDLAKIRLWLSHYSAKPAWPKNWEKPWLWQFTGDGKGPLPHAVAGINGTNLDINSFDGDGDKLAAEWTMIAPQAPPQPRALGAAASPRPAAPAAPAPAPAPQRPILNALAGVALAGHPIIGMLVKAGAGKLAAIVEKQSPAAAVVIDKVAAAIGVPADPDAIMGAHAADPEIVESAARAVENDPAMLAYLTAANASQAELLKREDERESWFSWAWRPAMSWLLIFLWGWNGVLVSTVNAITHIEIPPMPYDQLLAFTGVWLTIYGGGHTLKAVMGARAGTDGAG